MFFKYEIFDNTTVNDAMLSIVNLQFGLEKCPSCQNKVKNPRMLRCCHAYCEGCLIAMLDKNNRVSCYICNTVSHFRGKYLEDFTKGVTNIMHHELFKYDKHEVESAQENLSAIQRCYTQTKCNNCSTGYNKIKNSSKMFYCVDCKTAYYCSRECQKSHWKFHRADCIQMKKCRELIYNANHRNGTPYMDNDDDITYDIYVIKRGGSNSITFAHRHMDKNCPLLMEIRLDTLDKTHIED